MSLNMFLDETKKQAESAEAVCTEIIEAMGQVIRSVEAFTHNDNLQGVTYSSAKTYMESTYKVLAEAMISLCFELMVQNKLIPTSYEADVSTSDIIEVQVEEQIRVIDNLFYTFGDDMKHIDGADALFDTLEMTKRQLQEKLELLYQFNYSSKDNFDYANELIANIMRGLEEVQSNKGYDPSTRTFSTASLDMSWSEGMEKSVPYFIDVPAGMNEEEYNAYRNLVISQIKQLEADGWDSAAINAYLTKLNTDLTKENAEAELTKYGEQMKLVGSDIYLLLFKNSDKTEKQKIDLVLGHMGAVTDENGMLQLGFMKDKDGNLIPKPGAFKFDPRMAPNDKFLHEFAKCVQSAYKYDPLPLEVHQFRMYIDKHNIEYIRNEYGQNGKLTDEQALEAYVNAELNGEKMYREDARLHNKFPVPEVFGSHEEANITITEWYEGFWQGDENRKRVSQDFHSEFILDKNGSFVSQWNVLEVNNGIVNSNPDYYNHTENFENQMTNGSSFNYADENDTKDKEESVHTHLDVDPPKTVDPKIRDDVNWSTLTASEYDYDCDNGKDNYSIWEDSGTSEK